MHVILTLKNPQSFDDCIKSLDDFEM